MQYILTQDEMDELVQKAELDKCEEAIAEMRKMIEQLQAIVDIALGLCRQIDAEGGKGYTIHDMANSIQNAAEKARETK